MPKRFYVDYIDEYIYGEMPQVWIVVEQTVTDGIPINDRLYDEIFMTREEAIDFALTKAGGLSVANDELPHENVDVEVEE